MDISDRIKQIMEHENLSVSQFSKLTGIGDQTLRTVVVMHRNKPSYDFLLKVIKACDWLSVEWLMTGIGSMERSDDDKQENTVGQSQMISLEPLVSYMRDKDEEIRRLTKANAQLEMRCAGYVLPQKGGVSELGHAVGVYASQTNV